VLPAIVQSYPAPLRVVFWATSRSLRDILLLMLPWSLSPIVVSAPCLLGTVWKWIASLALATEMSLDHLNPQYLVLSQLTRLVSSKGSRRTVRICNWSSISHARG
jgi:hypothetical protein